MNVYTLVAYDGTELKVTADSENEAIRAACRRHPDTEPMDWTVEDEEDGE